MSEGSPWSATISIHLHDPEVAGWLARALAPEAAREVPRASASVERPAPDTVRLSLRARDTGAARAALNTYLGWVHLTLETVRAARAARPGSSGPDSALAGERRPPRMR